MLHRSDVLESAVLRAADELNVTLSESEMSRAVYFLCALDTKANRLSFTVGSVAHWVVRFVLEFRT